MVRRILVALVACLVLLASVGYAGGSNTSEEMQVQVLTSTPSVTGYTSDATRILLDVLQDVDALADEVAHLTEEDIANTMVEAVRQGDMKRFETLSRYMSAKIASKYVVESDEGQVRTATIASSSFVLVHQHKDADGHYGALSHVHNICNMDIIHGATQYLGQISVTHIAYCLEPDTIRFRYRAEAHVLESTQSRVLTEFRRRGQVPGFFLPRVIDTSYYNTNNRYAYRLGSQTWVIPNTGRLIRIGVSGWPMVNKAGQLYPLYRHWSRPDYVHVPTQPFNPSRTNNGREFARNCQAYYQMRGWTYPQGDYQNHHMKPSRWGGSNAGSNCYRMPTNVHQLMFNNWWGSGNTKFETPVSR